MQNTAIECPYTVLIVAFGGRAVTTGATNVMQPAAAQERIV